MIAFELCLKNERFPFMTMSHETSDPMKDALLGPGKKTVFPFASGISLSHIFPPSPNTPPVVFHLSVVDLSQGTSWLTYKETILFVSALTMNDSCVPQSFENSDC